jgi:DNA-directed RNA polymerase subunit RPC12/RpoP
VWKRLSGGKLEMATTLIKKCVKCGGLVLAKMGQKTKTCPYCQSKVNLQKAILVASAKNSFEGSEILKRLKTKKASTHKPQ